MILQFWFYGEHKVINSDLASNFQLVYDESPQGKKGKQECSSLVNV